MCVCDMGLIMRGVVGVNVGRGVWLIVRDKLRGTINGVGLSGRRSNVVEWCGA